MACDIRNAGRGYIYVEMTIKDPEQYRRYAALSAPAVHAAGGRYLVRGAHPELLEGASGANRIAIVEFDTAELAREFYYSAVYQTARRERLTAADFKMTLVEGTPVAATGAAALRETSHGISLCLCPREKNSVAEPCDDLPGQDG